MADLLDQLWSYGRDLVLKELSPKSKSGGKLAASSSSSASCCKGGGGIAKSLSLDCAGMWTTRLAGLAGASAVLAGAYGAHALRNRAASIDKEAEKERRLRVYDVAVRYHLIHSVALLAAHRARSPLLTSSLFVTGILLFSGTSYYYALTGNETYSRLTPLGGLAFIAAWLTFCL